MSKNKFFDESNPVLLVVSFGLSNYQIFGFL